MHSRHDDDSKFNAVEVHALEINGPPPEQVPRKVIETGFIRRGGRLQAVLRALVALSLTTTSKIIGS
jgi:hypothetical protein